MNQLQIRELMIERKRGRKRGGKNGEKGWGAATVIGLLCLTGMLGGIAFLQDETAYSILISLIAFPLLFSVFSFYNWFCAFLSAKRKKQPEALYQNDRLYILAQSTSKANPVVNSIFSVCLLFAGMSFSFGIIMLHPKADIFNQESQQWMGFLQSSISIIFIVIYFSILSLQQIIEFRQKANDIQILYYIGKSKTQLKRIVQTEAFIKLSVPMVMCLVPLFIAVPLLNYRLNAELPYSMRHIVLQSTGWFFLCFFILYLCYFFVICVMCGRYIDGSVSKRISAME